MLTKDEARRIAVNVARLPERTAIAINTRSHARGGAAPGAISAVATRAAQKVAFSTTILMPTVIAADSSAEIATRIIVSRKNPAARRLAAQFGLSNVHGRPSAAASAPILIYIARVI
jgi:hypothetical protein